MKKSLFTICFMIVITIVFIAMLAFMNEITKAAIEQNLQVDRYKSILYAFDIFPENFDEASSSPTSTTADLPWQRDDVLASIRKNIRQITLSITPAQRKLLNASVLTLSDSLDIYVHINDSGAPLAYGFPMKGKGLWGTITAFGVVDSSLKRMIGIDFTDQVETPGLGARILEKEFKYFFRQLDISGFGSNQISPVQMVVRKEQANVEAASNSFQSITGATQTVNGVLAMMNIDLAFYIDVLQANQTLISEKLLDES